MSEVLSKLREVVRILEEQEGTPIEEVLSDIDESCETLRKAGFIVLRIEMNPELRNQYIDYLLEHRLTALTNLQYNQAFVKYKGILISRNHNISPYDRYSIVVEERRV